MSRVHAFGLSCIALGLSAGCNFELPDEIKGLTSRFVVQGMYLGIESPDDENIATALEESDFGESGQVTAFFADAANADEIENAPIGGLSPVFRSPTSGSFDLVEDGDGRYTLDDGATLTYVGDESVVVSVNYQDVDRKVPIDAPTGPDFSLAETHTAGAAMVINLEGQGFDTTLVMVLDLLTGDMTWDNLPTDITEVFDLGGEDEDGLIVEIPGVAFADESFYAVGVGGLLSADTVQFEEVNTLLSGFKAGTMSFQPVCTFAETLLCEQ